MKKGFFKRGIVTMLTLAVSLCFGLTAFAADPGVSWTHDSYEAYAEKQVGMELYKTENKVQFYNTFVDQSKLTKETTIDTLFDSAQEGYSTELLLSLNPVQLTEEAPVFKGKDGNYYVVTSVYGMNDGLDPRDSQPATSFYNYLADAFTDIEYIGKGVFRIPEKRYEYCFNGHYFTDGPEGNIVEIVFGLRIQSLYGYDPAAVPTTKSILVTVTEGKETREVPGTLNMATGTIEVQLLPDEADGNMKNYSIEAVVNRGESMASILTVSDDGKNILFVAGDSHAIGAFDVAISKDGVASTGLMTAPEIIAEKAANRGATKLASTSTTVVNNITYLDLPAGAVPANLAVGDKFIYQHKNVYVAGVQNNYDGGNYAGLTGTYNGTTSPTSLHIGSANIPTHETEWFCYYNNLTNWTAISNWFKQTNGYSQLNDPTKPDTNTAIAGSMVPMTVANMNERARDNGWTSNLGGAKIFGYISEKLGAVTDTSGTKTLNLNETQLIFGCMHAWAYESATTPTAVGQAIATFAGTSEIAQDQYCGNYYPNLALQCTSVTVDGNYTNATFKCCTSMLGVGGMKEWNKNNYQCAFATLYVRYPNPTGEVTVRKVWVDEDNEYYTQPEEIEMTLWSDYETPGIFTSTGKTAVFDMQGGWADVTITNLPIYCNGSSSMKVSYYVVEPHVPSYRTEYSTDGTNYVQTSNAATVNTGGTLYVRNTNLTEPLTPYGVTAISKTVQANGSTVTTNEEFLFRIDIQYSPSVTNGPTRTVIPDYTRFRAIRYVATGSSSSTLVSLTGDTVKNAIVHDPTKPVSFYLILKGGERAEFNIYDKDAAVSITELSASDPDLVSVAQFLGKTGAFSDRYISAVSGTRTRLVAYPDQTFSWGNTISIGSSENSRILTNLTVSYTVDRDKREYSFYNNRAYDLTIRKVIEGSMASRSDFFTINVFARDDYDDDLNGTFNVVNSWVDSNGTTVTENGTVTFVDGEATISLRGGSSVRIKGLPGRSEYAVVEEDYTSQGYVTTYQNRVGSLSNDTVVTVTNRRDGVIPTGIHTNAVPIIGVTAVSALALFGIYVLCKKRRRTS